MKDVCLFIIFAFLVAVVLGVGGYVLLNVINSDLPLWQKLWLIFYTGA